MIRSPKASELWQSYQRGWVDGAKNFAQRRNGMDEARQELRDEYDQGMSDGIIAREDALRAAAKRLGHVPSVLRGKREAQG